MKDPGNPMSSSFPSSLLLEHARQLAAESLERHDAVRLHSSIGCVAWLDHPEAQAEAMRAGRDRKLTKAREARRLRRAQATRDGEPQELLTIRKDMPMLHPAGEADAGSVWQPPARDKRPGRRMTVVTSEVRSQLSILSGLTCSAARVSRGAAGAVAPRVLPCGRRGASSTGTRAHPGRQST